MLLSEGCVAIKWNRFDREYYEEKGYLFTKYKDEFQVKIEDLNPSSHERIIAKCDKCGKIQNISYKDYNRNISYNNGLYVCQSCSVSVRHSKTLETRRNDYMKRLQEKCLTNGYTILSSKDEIFNNTSIIRYNCKAHGEQSMRLSNFLSGKECPMCNLEKQRERYQLSYSDVIKRITECGGVIINPEDYINVSERNLEFICNECGNTFVSSFKIYTQRGGTVCKNCKNSESIGEKKIRHFLETNNISFVQQKWFKDCRDLNPLPFDFFLPEHRTIIEFDGRQHFTETDWFSYSLDKTKLHDEIKNDYCSKNGIKMIRIPYTEINHIDDILTHELLT